MAEVAKAYVSLMPSAKGFGKGVSNQIGGDLDSAGKSGGKRLGAGVRGGFLPSIKGLMGPIAALFAVGTVVNFFKSANAEARESQKVNALTANVIKTTGGVAKVTAGQVGELSMAISNKTGIDDEAIQHGANLLLTFKNVRNEVGKGANIFDRATAAAADLSAAGFGDLAGSSKQLGKALNDPTVGMVMLGRAGVTFSAEQKKQIKAMQKVGNLLGAQKLMMAEIESQVGGSAAASATAGEKLATTWKNLKETLGTALLPALDTAMTAVSGFLGGFTSSFEKGGISQVFTDIGAKITASWPGTKAKLGEWLGALGSWIWGTALPAIGAQLAKWGVAFWAWIQPQIVPMLTKLGELLGALGTWLLNVGLPWLGEHLKTWGIAFWAWIQPMIPPFLAELGKLLLKLFIWMETVARPAIDKQLAQWAWSFIKWIGPMILPFLAELAKLQGRLIIWMVTVALPAIVAKLAEWALAFIKWIPGAALSLLIEMNKLTARLVIWMVTTALPQIVRSLARWNWAFLSWVGGVIASLPGRLPGLLAVLTTWASGVPGKIVSALGDLGSILRNAGSALIGGLLSGITKKFEEVKTFIGGIGSWIAANKGPLSYDRKLLIPAGSAIMSGLNEGITAGFSDVQANVSGLAGRLSMGSLDFASSAQRSAAVGGIDYDRLARAFSRVNVQSYLDGKNVTASVDQRIGMAMR